MSHNWSPPGASAPLSHNLAPHVSRPPPPRPPNTFPSSASQPPPPPPPPPQHHQQHQQHHSAPFSHLQPPSITGNNSRDVSASNHRGYNHNSINNNSNSSYNDYNHRYNSSNNNNYSHQDQFNGGNRGGGGHIRPQFNNNKNRNNRNNNTDGNNNSSNSNNSSYNNGNNRHRNLHHRNNSASFESQRDPWLSIIEGLIFTEKLTVQLVHDYSFNCISPPATANPSILDFALSPSVEIDNNDNGTDRGDSPGDQYDNLGGVDKEADEVHNLNSYEDGESSSKKPKLANGGSEELDR